LHTSLHFLMLTVKNAAFKHPASASINKKALKEIQENP
jgi:hypothetical protein